MTRQSTIAALALAVTALPLACRAEAPAPPPGAAVAPAMAQPTIPLPPQKKEATMSPDMQAPIGTATMREDGTLELTMRAEGPGGVTGDAQFTYAPTDPNYAEVLKHLGGMKPGDTKPVPPWPE